MAIQVGAYIVFSYLPFLASTAVDMSGVVSILFTGITMKHYTHNNISEEAQDMCVKSWTHFSQSNQPACTHAAIVVLVSVPPAAPASSIRLPT